MSREEIAREADAWLSKARDDLRAARVLLAADPPLPGDAAFHSQQSVEKALKALLTLHRHPFQKTHDVGKLSTACLEHEPELHDLLRSAVPLTEYAWRFRYPGRPFAPPVDEVSEAIEIATEVLTQISPRMDGSTR